MEGGAWRLDGAEGGPHVAVFVDEVADPVEVY